MPLKTNDEDIVFLGESSSAMRNSNQRQRRYSTRSAKNDHGNGNGSGSVNLAPAQPTRGTRSVSVPPTTPKLDAPKMPKRRRNKSGGLTLRKRRASVKYLFDDIVKEEEKNGQAFFEVKWRGSKGCPEPQNTWEPASAFSEKDIQEFRAKQQRKEVSPQEIGARENPEELEDMPISPPTPAPTQNLPPRPPSPEPQPAPLQEAGPAPRPIPQPEAAQEVQEAPHPNPLGANALMQQIGGPPQPQFQMDSAPHVQRSLQNSIEFIQKTGVHDTWPTRYRPIMVIGGISVENRLVYVVRRRTDQRRREVPFMEQLVFVDGESFQRSHPELVISYYLKITRWQNQEGGPLEHRQKIVEIGGHMGYWNKPTND